MHFLHLLFWELLKPPGSGGFSLPGMVLYHSMLGCSAHWENSLLLLALGTMQEERGLLVS